MRSNEGNMLSIRVWADTVFLLAELDMANAIYRRGVILTHESKNCQVLGTY
jgi:hypothetical protein